MKLGSKHISLGSKQISLKWTWTIVLVLAAGMAWGFRGQIVSVVRHWTGNSAAGGNGAARTGDDSADADAHHHHAGDEENPTSVHLTSQARANIGLTDEFLKPIALQKFIRMISVPAIVAEKPGRSKISVAAPMTGIVTDVYAVKGEAVQSTKLLFKIRLTHEDLVQAQTTFLKTLGDLDVEKREIARLKTITDKGVVAGKVLLEHEYSQEKLQAELKAHREALLLHGLSSEQIDEISTSRHLLGELQVRVPPLDATSGEVQLDGAGIKQASTTTADVTATSRGAAAFVVQELNVSKGQFVQAGDPLCVLMDLSELYIEGRAFEHDAQQLLHAANSGWTVAAITEDKAKDPERIENLQIVYVENQVDKESRALHFYVRLPNRVLFDTVTPDGYRFITFRYRPGQRMQLAVPVEEWSDRFVLPVDAVDQEGPECFVFHQNGDHFERRPVHVEYRDQFSVVIANDGSLFPGDTIALTGAHQMNMALKAQSGGGVDPHAGHSHEH